MVKDIKFVAYSYDLFTDYLRQRTCWYLLLSQPRAQGGLADHTSADIKACAKGYLKDLLAVKQHLTVCFLQGLMGLLSRFSLVFQKKKLTVADYWNTVVILQYTMAELGNNLRNPYEFPMNVHVAVQEHFGSFVKACQQPYPPSHPQYDTMSLAFRNVQAGNATARGSRSSNTGAASFHEIHARCVEDVIQIMQAVLTTLSANITSYPGSTTRIHGGAQAQKML